MCEGRLIQWHVAVAAKKRSRSRSKKTQSQIVAEFIYIVFQFTTFFFPNHKVKISYKKLPEKIKIIIVQKKYYFSLQYANWISL